jgi:hypothetical protein
VVTAGGDVGRVVEFMVALVRISASINSRGSFLMNFGGESVLAGTGQIAEPEARAHKRRSVANFGASIFFARGMSAHRATGTFSGSPLPAPYCPFTGPILKVALGSTRRVR